MQPDYPANVFENPFLLGPRTNEFQDEEVTAPITSSYEETTVAAVTTRYHHNSTTTTSSYHNIEPIVWEATCTGVFILLGVLCCILAMKCLFMKYKRSINAPQRVGYLGDRNRRVIQQQDEEALPPYSSGEYPAIWETGLPQYSDVTQMPTRVCVEEEPPPPYDSVIVQKHIVSGPVKLDDDKTAPTTEVKSP